jgi:hypothetical protein
VRWLAVLKLFLPGLERSESAPGVEAATDRVRRSIAKLEGYIATHLHTDPWRQLEYYCHICLERLSWTGNGWEGRQLAFMEEEYDQAMAQIEEIETGRYLPPLPYVPLLQAAASPNAVPE